MMINVSVQYVCMCMYVCMVITYSKNTDQPGKVANPAVLVVSWAGKIVTMRGGRRERVE